MNRVHLITVIFALGMQTRVAQAADYTYLVTNGTITITRCIGPSGEVTIPNKINGLPVTRIGDWAFHWCSGLTTITIPNSVTSIGVDAFSQCTRLTNITIPDSVTSIGGGAFSYCTSLTSVTIPNSVTDIGQYAFAYCTSLISFTIPNSVTDIRPSAFAFCTSLISVTIPSSVTSIGTSAFSDCYSLTSVAIPNSVTNIGFWAFGNCSGLSGVYFQGNAPLPWYAFQGDNSAVVFYLPGTTGWDANYVGRPTALWVPVILTTTTSLGIQTNGLGFTISWAPNRVVLVEASKTLNNPAWTPLATNTLLNGVSQFSDQDWNNHSARFYRVRAQ